MYQFIHTRKAINSDEIVDEINHTLHDGYVDAGEVVMQFYYFMIGCSFHPTNITNAFRQVAEELNPEEYELEIEAEDDEVMTAEIKTFTYNGHTFTLDDTDTDTDDIDSEDDTDGYE